MNNSTYTDLGLISYHLSNNQHTENMLRLLHNLAKNRPFNQYVVFNSYSDVIDNLSVPILHVSQSKFFYGNLLVCDVPSLLLAIKCVNYNNIFFYSMDIPWEQDIRQYSYWHEIFTSNNLHIIAQDQRIYDIFSLTWKTPVATIKDLNYESINTIL